MQHAFGSVQGFLPSPEEIKILQWDFTIIIARVLFKNIPYFRQFRNIVPEFISQPEYPELESETTVIPLPVLYKN